VPILPAWDAFLSAAAKVKLAVEVASRTLESVRYHLERQWAPMIATLMIAAGGELAWLIEVMHSGRARMGPRHYALLE
jgi:hypothetical protein